VRSRRRARLQVASSPAPEAAAEAPADGAGSISKRIARIERLAATSARDWDTWQALHTAVRTAPELEQPLEGARHARRDRARCRRLSPTITSSCAERLARASGGDPLAHNGDDGAMSRLLSPGAPPEARACPAEPHVALMQH
jgi:hypothetical protein